MNISQRKHKM